MGRRTIVLVVALLLAAISAVAVWSFLRGVEDDVRADIEEVTVFRASQLIEPGTEGQTALDFIEESTENAQYLPPTAIQTRDALEELLTDTLAAGPISEGQIVTTDLWVSAADIESAKLSDLVAPGKVALALRADEVTAVGGYVRPGDKVNVVASTSLSLANFTRLLEDPEARELLLDLGLDAAIAEPEPPAEEEPVAGEGEEQTEAPVPPIDIPDDEAQVFASALPASLQFTQTVLQNIEVLATGATIRNVSPGEGLTPAGGQVFIFEVTPRQAEEIIFAQQYTSIRFVLVPPGYDEFQSQGVVIDDLFTLVDRLLGQLEGAVGGG